MKNIFANFLIFFRKLLDTEFRAKIVDKLCTTCGQGVHKRRGQTITPFVLGIAPALRASGSTAARIALPDALKHASILW